MEHVEHFGAIDFLICGAAIALGIGIMLSFYLLIAWGERKSNFITHTFVSIAFLSVLVICYRNPFQLFIFGIFLFSLPITLSFLLIMSAIQTVTFDVPFGKASMNMIMRFLGCAVMSNYGLYLCLILTNNLTERHSELIFLPFYCLYLTSGLFTYLLLTFCPPITRRLDGYVAYKALEIPSNQ